MISIKELAEWVDKEKIHVLYPYMLEWQSKNTYAAYVTFDPPGCELAEDENPVRALLKLYEKLHP